MISEAICALGFEVRSISNKIIIGIVRCLVIINDCLPIHRIGNNADRQRVAIGVAVVGQDIDLDWIFTIADRTIVYRYWRLVGDRKSLRKFRSMISRIGRRCCDKFTDG